MCTPRETLRNYDFIKLKTKKQKMRFLFLGVLFNRIISKKLQKNIMCLTQYLANDVKTGLR